MRRRTNSPCRRAIQPLHEETSPSRSKVSHRGTCESAIPGSGHGHRRTSSKWRFVPLRVDSAYCRRYRRGNFGGPGQYQSDKRFSSFLGSPAHRSIHGLLLYKRAKLETSCLLINSPVLQNVVERRKLIRQIACSHDGPIVAVAEFERFVQIWNVESQRCIAKVETTLDFGGRRLAITRDGLGCVVGAYHVHGVALYETKSGTEVWRRKDLKGISTG